MRSLLNWLFIRRLGNFETVGFAIMLKMFLEGRFFMGLGIFLCFAFIGDFMRLRLGLERSE